MRLRLLRVLVVVWVNRRLIKRVGLRIGDAAYEWVVDVIMTS